MPEAREARLAQLREHNAVVNRFVCIFFSSKLQAVVDNLDEEEDDDGLAGKRPGV